MPRQLQIVFQRSAALSAMSISSELLGLALPGTPYEQPFLSLRHGEVQGDGSLLWRGKSWRLADHWTGSR